MNSGDQRDLGNEMRSILLAHFSPPVYFWNLKNSPRFVFDRPAFCSETSSEQPPFHTEQVSFGTPTYKIQTWKLLISFTAGTWQGLAQVLFVFFNRLFSYATCNQILDEQEDFKLVSKP